jgi:pimeloyl-ACP methyl ester carboxylesterase
MRAWPWIVGVLGVATAAAALVVVLAALRLQRDMQRAYERIEHGGSEVVASPWGQIEFKRGGAADAGAPAVLVVHGSGGGYDQGELLARAALDERLRWVAPSRFGYLRSTFREGATFDDQAHAYAHLLDRLGVERVAVVALSHGGPSALLFALLHPERVSSLTLVSAGVASAGDAAQQQAHRQGGMLTAIYQRDWRYWVLTHAWRGGFLELMGASAAVVAGLDDARRQLVDEVIDGMNPVSRRAAGTVFDHRAAMPNERIAGIRVPTLVLHARDDTLQLWRNAEYAAQTIPGARLAPFERGGHLLLAVERDAVRRLTTQHVLEHARAQQAPPPARAQQAPPPAR